MRKLPEASTISSVLQHSSSSSSTSSSSSSSPSSFCSQAGSFTTSGFEPMSAFSSNTILQVKQEGYLGQMPHYQVNKDSLQQLIFCGGDQASCSSSDGSCNNDQQAFLQNNNFFHNGVGQENQKVVLSNGDTINVNGNGLWGSEQTPLEYYGVEEIKQLISSSTNNNAATTSCSNFLFDENKTTEERVLYYYWWWLWVKSIKKIWRKCGKEPKGKRGFWLKDIEIWGIVFVGSGRGSRSDMIYILMRKHFYFLFGLYMVKSFLCAFLFGKWCVLGTVNCPPIQT